MNLSPTLSLLWWLLIALETVLSISCLVQKIYRQYQTFVLYVCYCCLRSLVLHSLSSPGSYAPYFYAYWIGMFAEQCLLIGVLAELASFLFLPYWIIPAEPKRVFHYLAAVFLSVSLLLPVVSHSHISSLGAEWYLLAVCRNLARTVSIGIFGVTLLGILLSIRLETPWKRQAIWIASGLMVRFGIDSLYWCLSLNTHGAGTTALLWIKEAGAIAGCGLWIFAAYVPEHEAISHDPDLLDRMENFARNLSGMEEVG